MNLIKLLTPVKPAFTTNGNYIFLSVANLLLTLINILLEVNRVAYPGWFSRQSESHQITLELWEIIFSIYFSFSCLEKIKLGLLWDSSTSRNLGNLRQQKNLITTNSDILRLKKQDKNGVLCCNRDILVILNLAVW